MSLSFDKLKFASIEAIPENLRDQEMYPKFAAMVDHIVKQLAEDWEDIRFKYRGPDVVREDVIKEIITEYGHAYIRSVMDTITNFQFNTLLQFLSLISLLKGSRQGLELVLQLLGFDSVIQEWWEKTPKGEPYTFELTVMMDSSNIPDVFETLARVEVFARAYVFPLMQNVDFRFGISFGQRTITHAGFWFAHYSTAKPIARRI